jgi:hypothetical protein
MISSLQSLYQLKLGSVSQGTSLSQEIYQLGEEPRTYESNKVMDFGHPRKWDQQTDNKA